MKGLLYSSECGLFVYVSVCKRPAERLLSSRMWLSCDYSGSIESQKPQMPINSERDRDKVTRTKTERYRDSERDEICDCSLLSPPPTQAARQSVKPVDGQPKEVAARVSSFVLDQFLPEPSIRRP